MTTEEKLQPSIVERVRRWAAELPLAQIVVTDLNPRRHFDEEALRELADSIAEDGLHQAILVRPLEPEDGEPRYELVAGERRLRAHELLGREVIEAKVREMDAATAARVRLTENLQREDLSELEEAAALQRLRDEAGLPVEELAAQIGKSASYVYQRLKLLELSEPVQDALAAGEITAGHAIEMARLTPAFQERALAATLRKGFDGRVSTTSVRDLRSWIRKNAHLSLAETPWDKDDPDLVPAAGSCATCPKRTGNAAALWPDVEDGATCTDPDCFIAKKRAYLDARAAALEEAGDPFIRISEETWSVQRHHHESEQYPTITAGTLGRSDYRLAEDEPCEHAGPALVVDGERAGEVVKACWDRGCDVHWHAEDHDDEKAAARRRTVQRWNQEAGRRAAEDRRVLARALADKAPGGLGPTGILRAAIVRLFPEVWAERQGPVLDELGIEGEGLPALAAWCDEHGTGSLWRALLTLALCAPIAGKAGPLEVLSGEGDALERYRLEPLVEAAGLDAGALRAEARGASSIGLPRDALGLTPVWVLREGGDEFATTCHVAKGDVADGEPVSARCGHQLDGWVRVEADGVIPSGYIGSVGRYLDPCDRCVDSLIKLVQTSAEEET